MVLVYSEIARLNPQEMDAPKHFYAQVENSKQYTQRMLAGDISFSTSISPIDMATVQECLLKFTPNAKLKHRMGTAECRKVKQPEKGL